MLNNSKVNKMQHTHIRKNTRSITSNIKQIIANTKYELPALDLIFNDKLATGKRSIKLGYWVVRYANPKVTDKQRTMFVARELRKQNYTVNVIKTRNNRFRLHIN